MRCQCALLVFLLMPLTCFAGADSHTPSAVQDVGLVGNQSENGRSSTLKPRRMLILPDADGVVHSLSEWQGKVIMLNFWASWCSPCQYEIRDLVLWQEKYGSQGLQVIGVGVDEVRKLRNVQRTLDINYPVLVADPAIYPNVMAAWDNPVGTVPHTVVINRDGSVVYIHRGLMREETFAGVVLPLLDHNNQYP